MPNLHATFHTRATTQYGRSGSSLAAEMRATVTALTSNLQRRWGKESVCCGVAHLTGHCVEHVHCEYISTSLAGGRPKDMRSNRMYRRGSMRCAVWLGNRACHLTGTHTHTHTHTHNTAGTACKPLGIMSDRQPVHCGMRADESAGLAWRNMISCVPHTRTDDGRASGVISEICTDRLFVQHVTRLGLTKLAMQN